MVELATFQLRDLARGWYQTVLRGRPAGSPPLAWDEFTNLFLAHFLPKSIRVSRAREFESLVQTDQMTVTDYHIQFERLSQYASHFVAIEELRVQRFC